MERGRKNQSITRSKAKDARGKGKTRGRRNKKDWQIKLTHTAVVPLSLSPLSSHCIPYRSLASFLLTWSLARPRTCVGRRKKKDNQRAGNCPHSARGHRGWTDGRAGGFRNRISFIDEYHARNSGNKRNGYRGYVRERTERLNF